MFRGGLGEDQDVIQIDENEPVDHVTEDVVDQGLEHSRSVGQPAGHNQVFKVSKGGVEGCFPFVSLADTDKVVCTAQVQFGEDSSAKSRGAKAELIKGRGYLFLIAMLFRPQKSIHGFKVPSFLLTKKKTAPTGEEEGRMIPAARESWMYFSIASCSGRERL